MDNAFECVGLQQFVHSIADKFWVFRKLPFMNLIQMLQLEQSDFPCDHLLSYIGENERSIFLYFPIREFWLSFSFLS